MFFVIFSFFTVSVVHESEATSGKEKHRKEIDYDKGN